MKVRKMHLGIVGLVHFLSGIVYFYFRNSIPLEITWGWLRDLMVVLFLISPFLLGIIIGSLIPQKFQSNKSLGCLSVTIVILLLMHNLVWTFIVFLGDGEYRDRQIIYPDQGNRQRKIITQYHDAAWGGHIRVIEVYEFLPFVRYIDSVKYSD